MDPSDKAGRPSIPYRAVGLALLAGTMLATGALAGCLEKRDDGTGGDLGNTGGGAGEGSGTGSGQTVTLRQAGSSTVLPIAQAWAEEFERLNRNVRIVVEGGGSGAGFKKFCRGETDISDASRPIKASEVDDCRAIGIEPYELQVATDGLAVTVSNENTFVDFLTVEELNRIWTADASKQANRWSDLRPEWPAEEIELYGPGTDSGTFDYFVEVIIAPFDGDESKGRADYVKSEDDNVLVQGVRGSPYALGYFGLAYAVENANTIKTVAIDDEDPSNGDGPQQPTNANVEDGLYQPLARPIFMYTDGKPTGVLKTYFAYGYSEEGQALTEDVGYIKLDAAKLAQMRQRIA